MTIDRNLYKKYKGRFPDPDGHRAEALGMLGLAKPRREPSLAATLWNPGRRWLVRGLVGSILAGLIFLFAWAW